MYLFYRLTDVILCYAHSFKFNCGSLFVFVFSAVTFWRMVSQNGFSFSFN